MNDKVKDTAEELLIKIMEYIVEAEPDTQERDYRFIELACSLIFATINVDDDLMKIYSQVHSKCEIMSHMMMSNVARYKSGDKSRVKKIFVEDK